VLQALQRLLAVKQERVRSAERHLRAAAADRDRAAEHVDSSRNLRDDAQRLLDHSIRRRLEDKSLRTSFARLKWMVVHVDEMKDLLDARENDVHQALARLEVAERAIQQAQQALGQARREMEKTDHCCSMARSDAQRAERRREEAEGDAFLELRVMRSYSLEKVS
jgi:chromosome segregation ATPase